MNYKVINAPTGAIVVGARPFTRKDKVTTEMVQDPVKLAETLTRMSNITTELSQDAQKGQTIVFQDVACPELGSTIRLQHNLDKRVMWRVVDWSDPATGALPTTAPALVRSALDTTNNVLVLRSYVLGTASIEVF